MNYEVISTGSEGNALLIGNEILIDCGVSYRKLKEKPIKLIFSRKRMNEWRKKMKAKEIELAELLKKTLESFEIKEIEELKDKIFEITIKNQYQYYKKFLDFATELDIDYMQKIYQYYLADRKGLKQDYTPKSLSKLLSKIVGDEKDVVDICAGTGALTIQSWAEDKTRKFKLYEIDDNVIPFLIFNMAIRNIYCEIYHADVLRDKVFNKYLVVPGEKFGEVIKCQ